MRYVVTAPMINCHSPSAVPAPPPGYRSPPIAAFCAGAVLPDDVPAEDTSRLLAAGLIAADPG